MWLPESCGHTVSINCPVLTDYSDDDVNQDGLESGFEGAFHNFAMGDGVQDNLIAMATDAIAFQGVEPMGERQLH